MPSINARLHQIAAAIERRKLEATLPVDPLSRSLADFHRWLCNADESELTTLTDSSGKKILTLEEARRMIRNCREGEKYGRHLQTACTSRTAAPEVNPAFSSGVF